MHRHLPGILGRRGTRAAQMGQVTPSPRPHLFCQFLSGSSLPLVSQHLCALEVPGKSPVWPLAQKQAPGDGGGSCLLILCLLAPLGRQRRGMGTTCGLPRTVEEGRRGEGQEQGHLEPKPFLGEWMCLKVAVQHVWHEAGRRDGSPEVCTWLVHQRAAWSCAGTVDFPRTLSRCRGPALTHRAPEHIPGKGKGNTQG